MDNLIGSQMPGQTNVNDTWNFSGPRFLPAHLAALGAALDTTPHHPHNHLGPGRPQRLPHRAEDPVGDEE